MPSLRKIDIVLVLSVPHIRPTKTMTVVVEVHTGQLRQNALNVYIFFSKNSNFFLYKYILHSVFHLHFVKTHKPEENC